MELILGFQKAEIALAEVTSVISASIIIPNLNEKTRMITNTSISLNLFYFCVQTIRNTWQNVFLHFTFGGIQGVPLGMPEKVPNFLF